MELNIANLAGQALAIESVLGTLIGAIDRKDGLDSTEALNAILERILSITPESEPAGLAIRAGMKQSIDIIQRTAAGLRESAAEKPAG